MRFLPVQSLTRPPVLAILVAALSLLNACAPASDESASSGEAATRAESAQQALSKDLAKDSALAAEPAARVAAVPAAQPLSSHYGYYVGMFYAEESDYKKNPMAANKINVSIDAIQGSQIKGHSVVAGNSRPFSGSISPAGTGKYKVVAKEPGNDPYDGVFTFTLDTGKKTVIGTWSANDKQLAVTKRSYELEKKSFKYDPNLALDNYTVEVYSPNMSDADHRAEGITKDAGKYNASLRALKSGEVENMYRRDLEVMRNAIYARHGYSFQNREMRVFFDNYVSWYIPVSIDVTKQLTPIEKQNIELLKRYEKHAATYYDRFGR